VMMSFRRVKKARTELAKLSLLFLAEHNNPFRRGLGRDASCGGAVVDHQKMIADAADKALAVGRRHPGIGADIQLQRIFGREKPLIKIGDHDILPRFRAGDESRLVLGWIDQRDWLAHIIKSGHAHTRAQRGVIRNISPGRKNEANHPVNGSDGDHLIAAFAAQGFDPFNNARNSGIISRWFHK